MITPVRSPQRELGWEGQASMILLKRQDSWIEYNSVDSCNRRSYIFCGSYAQQLSVCNGSARARCPGSQAGQPGHLRLAGREHQYESGDCPAAVARIAEGQASRYA